MRELSLDRLRTLVAIADLGSFAAAARALNLAPPTVSLHVAELEERIGAPLLLRQRGQKVVEKAAMGRTQTIQAQGGELWGYSDPRNPDGLTLGY